MAIIPSPFGAHQKVLFALSRVISVALIAEGCDATVVSELDWIVKEDTVVRPDLIVLCGDAPERHLEHPPALVAEIFSPSTRNNDLTYKKDLYESQGVDHYLTVDPDLKTIERFVLSSDGVHEGKPLSERSLLSICTECEFEIKIADVFI